MLNRILLTNRYLSMVVNLLSLEDMFLLPGDGKKFKTKPSPHSGKGFKMEKKKVFVEKSAGLCNSCGTQGFEISVWSTGPQENHHSGLLAREFFCPICGQDIKADISLGDS